MPVKVIRICSSHVTVWGMRAEGNVSVAEMSGIIRWNLIELNFIQMRQPCWTFGSETDTPWFLHKVREHSILVVHISSEQHRDEDESFPPRRNYAEWVETMKRTDLQFKWAVAKASGVSWIDYSCTGEKLELLWINFTASWLWSESLIKLFHV